MSEHRIDDQTLDYKLYRFGQMQQVFRGPPPDLGACYVAFLGGSGTFGRFAAQPYAEIAGRQARTPIANFGAEGAGPGFFLSDPEVLSIASNARVCVVQVMAASAITNRMFSVRPRRNGRLHAVSDLLAGIYPEIDFARFAYVHAMLRQLSRIADDRFRLVVNEMRNAWIARTHTLLASIQTKTLLFWFSRRAPDDEGADPFDGHHDPNFVDGAMIDSVLAGAESYIECVASDDGPRIGDRPAALSIDDQRDLPTAAMHQAAADLLVPEIRRLMKG